MKKAMLFLVIIFLVFPLVVQAQEGKLPRYQTTCPEQIVYSSDITPDVYEPLYGGLVNTIGDSCLYKTILGERIIAQRVYKMKIGQCPKSVEDLPLTYQYSTLFYDENEIKTECAYSDNYGQFQFVMEQKLVLNSHQKK